MSGAVRGCTAYMYGVYGVVRVYGVHMYEDVHGSRFKIVVVWEYSCFL